MFDQTLIRVCLILGSFITAGYILRRVRHEEKYTPQQKKDLLEGGLVCGIFLTLGTNLQQFGIADTTAGKAGFPALDVLGVSYPALDSQSPAQDYAVRLKGTTEVYTFTKLAQPADADTDTPADTPAQTPDTTPADTPEEPADEEIPPPNMSDRPPPLPL